MVHAETRYICDICYKEGMVRSEMMTHERTPLKGLDLNVGQVFGYIGYISRSEKDHLFVALISGKEVFEDHQVGYFATPYGLSLTGTRDWNNFTQIQIRDASCASCLTQLTDEEYAFAIEKLESDKKSEPHRFAALSTPFTKGIKKNYDTSNHYSHIRII